VSHPDDSRLADQLNKDPIVFADCTGPEIVAVFVIALVMGLIIGVLMGIVLLPFMMGLIAGLIITLALSWLLLMLVANARNRFYESWLGEKIFLFKRSLVGVISINESAYVDEYTRFGRGRRK
jgi:hypothetical protein